MYHYTRNQRQIIIINALYDQDNATMRTFCLFFSALKISARCQLLQGTYQTEYLWNSYFVRAAPKSLFTYSQLFVVIHK